MLSNPAMISLRTEPDFDVDIPFTSLRDGVDQFFEEGGALDRACCSEGMEFEPRPQQQEMAHLVAESLRHEEHLAVEAGTGVGKSFAYLVPSLLYAVGKGRPVVVSTHTISLQEQLILKDIPLLRKHMGLDFKAVLVKGQGNYLCLRRLRRALSNASDMFKVFQNRELQELAQWAEVAKEGSRQELAEEPSNDLWMQVNVERGNCLHKRCPEFGRCFFMAARRKIFGAHLLVVNHHLFFSDLALRRAGAALLPQYAVAVLDEAHQVESVAGSHLGLRLSYYSFVFWMRRLYQPDNGKGLLAILKAGELAQLVGRLYDEVEKLFRKVEEGYLPAGDNGSGPWELRTPMDIETGTVGLLGLICAKLRKLEEETEDQDWLAELGAVRRSGDALRDGLCDFLDQRLEDQVYWIERGGRRRKLSFHAAPVEVGPLLKEALFEGTEATIVLTSATLAVNSNLAYFCHRVGAEACATHSVGSPFDYERQMELLFPSDFPEPNDAQNYAPAVAKAVLGSAREYEGRTLVLFTSAALMKRVAALVEAKLVAEGLELLVQGQGMPRNAMVERFREDDGCVLFGLDSFWQGVDVRGEALRCVMITRLPFAVPDQPLIRARMERLQEQGANPFRDYSLPEAVLKFRQGVGRLIRTSTDTGVVIVLDRRIIGKSYGRMFVKSLPGCPHRVVNFLKEDGLND